MRELSEYNLTCEDVADMLQYNLEYVRKLASKEALPCIKHKGRWKFNKQEVMASLRVRKTIEKVKADDEGDSSINDLLR